LQTGMLLPILTNSQTRTLMPDDRLTKEEMENITGGINEQDLLINKKAKLFIIDFWDISCISCIASFPKMDSLQKTFNDQIQVILVNRQTEDATERFFKKRNKIIKPALPFITGDTIMNRYFPHVGEPYHVWIDSNGEVKLISYGHVTNIKSIDNYLTKGLLPGNAITAPAYVKSLFDEKWDKAMAYFSYLSRCIDNGMLHLRPEKKDAMIVADGCPSALTLYQIAYNERNQPYYRFNRAGRTILEAKNPEKYTEPESMDNYYEWVAEYGYNYHLYLPTEREAEKYKIMREDLARYFDLEAKIEKRRVKSFILKRKGRKTMLKSKGGSPKDNMVLSDKYISQPDSIRVYHNKSYEGFSRQMAYMLEKKWKQPFVDSTNYNGNIDIEISSATLDSMDMDSLNTELEKYGLVLIEKSVLMDVLVVRERE